MKDNIVEKYLHSQIRAPLKLDKVRHVRQIMNANI